MTAAFNDFCHDFVQRLSKRFNRASDGDTSHSTMQIDTVGTERQIGRHGEEQVLILSFTRLRRDAQGRSVLAGRKMLWLHFAARPDYFGNDWSFLHARTRDAHGTMQEEADTRAFQRIMVRMGERRAAANPAVREHTASAAFTAPTRPGLLERLGDLVHGVLQR